jgi:hypothetical protein
MDGGMVHIRQEGWKELKVGLIGQVISVDPPESSVIPEVHTVSRAYTAGLGDVETFAPALVQAAQHQGFFEVSQSSIVADGVPCRGRLPTTTSRSVCGLSIAITPLSIWPMLPKPVSPTSRRSRPLGFRRSARPCLKGRSSCVDEKCVSICYCLPMVFRATMPKAEE